MAKRLSMVSDESFSSFSPIREEPEQEIAASDKIYNLRPKRISFSTPKKPQTLRYASCSNLTDYNSSVIINDSMNDSISSIKSLAAEISKFKAPKPKKFLGMFRRKSTRKPNKRRSVEMRIDDDIVIWEEDIPSPKKRKTKLLKRLSLSNKAA